MKNKVIHLRLSDEEKNMIEEAAEKKEMSSSDYIRNILLSKDLPSHMNSEKGYTKILNEINLNIKRNRRYLILQSFNILRIRFIVTYTFNFIFKLFENKIPSDYKVLSDTDRDEFVNHKMKEMEADVQRIQ